ncbi:MAG: N-6 DNA methylase [Bacteroidetes bacterium]|nr:N-6 DNA methylase [Bacteroidota bacterium]
MSQSTASIIAEPPLQAVVATQRVLDAGRDRARRQIRQAVDADRHLPAARSFVKAVLASYWEHRAGDWPLPAPIAPFETVPLTGTLASLAHTLGTSAARLDVLEAGHRIGQIYMRLLPRSFRAQYGVYYTPPILTRRLIESATEAGADWATDTVLDPACGGGAFLAPIAQQMVDALPELPPEAVLDHIAEHLHGFEIDPFGAWMSQVMAEAVLLDVCRSAGRHLPPLVTVCDSLEQVDRAASFDVVLGNPPYGKVKLSKERRAHFDRSLYGHANLYGLFTDVAVHLTRPGGVIAYVTPTSFLAGQYFKALRDLLGREAPPINIDFVATRKGVFDDVLQETLLATYQRGGMPEQAARVCVIEPTDDEALAISRAGTCRLPEDPSQPWIIPRSSEQAPLVAGMQRLPHRLSDYGYCISTGPLVWNRHKSQLRTEHGPGTYPLVWAEAVASDGTFIFRAEKRNHVPYFAPEDDQDWLLTGAPCVLVQRTTAKEQHRRLIAAVLPRSFVESHGAVVIENHLNMIYPGDGTPHVSPRTLATLLNSDIVDQAFRCISGSVAVSAYELEALPLPSPDAMKRIEAAVEADAGARDVEALIRDAYLT